MVFTLPAAVLVALQGLPQPDFSRHFQGFTATFILRNQSSGETLTHAPQRLDERRSPCSTFKIVNSLIGLETGVLSGPEHLYRWDGRKHPDFPQWERDHTLRSAFRESVVWYYQRLASEIGEDRMREHLNALGYGDRNMSAGLTTFWLGSSLKVSAREQMHLLDRLSRSTLPFSERTQDTVRHLMLIDRGDGWSLYGKTGSMRESDGFGLGWFVGWVERSENRYLFVAQIRGKGAWGPRARAICRGILAEMRLVPAS